MSFETQIKKAKGKRKSSKGSHHWIMQKLSAILLVFLSIYMLKIVGDVLIKQIPFQQILSSIYSLVFINLFFAVVLWHASLGLETIIEDYVERKCCKFFLIYSIKIINLVTIIILLLTLTKIYLSGVIS